MGEGDDRDMPAHRRLAVRASTTAILLSVKRVAVIGASCDPRKSGYKAVVAFGRQGYEVIPINPHESEIGGLQTYRSVLDVPGAIDLATIYVPPPKGLSVLAEVAEKRIPEVWLNPGAESPDLIQRARELGLEPIVACSIMAICETP